MNNILNLDDPKNQQFIASVICSLCEDAPLIVDLETIERYWNGEVKRLQYDLVATEKDDGKLTGYIAFSLRPKEQSCPSIPKSTP